MSSLNTEEELCLLSIAHMLEVLQEIRRSPLGLYKHIFTAKDGSPVIIKDFHVEWNRLVTDPKLRGTLIEASRGLSKTSFVLAYILWRIGKNPNIRIKLLTESEKNAKKRVGMLHDIIDNSLLYQAAFPEVRKSPNRRHPNNTTSITLERTVETPEPTVEGNGVTAAGTGGRSDELILDDIVGESNAVKNPALKPKVLEKLQTDWMPTLTDDGRAISIYTPWAEDDANAWLRKKAKWHYSKFAHGTPTDPYHSAFPEIWPREALIERRRWIGLLAYTRQYLLQTTAVGTSIISPEHLLPYVAVPQAIQYPDPNQLTLEKLNDAMAINSIDPAAGQTRGGAKRSKNDFTGNTVLLAVNTEHLPHHPSYQVFVPESFQINVPITSQPFLAHSLSYQWGAAACLYESNGMQVIHPWIIEYQKDHSDFRTPILPIKLGNVPKGQRLMSIVPMINQPDGYPPIVLFHPRTIDTNPQPDQIVLADGVQHEILRDLREQLLSFGAHAHDDISDSLVQGLSWIHFLVRQNGNRLPSVEELGLDAFLPDFNSIFKRDDEPESLPAIFQPANLW